MKLSSRVEAVPSTMDNLFQNLEPKCMSLTDYPPLPPSPPTLSSSLYPTTLMFDDSEWMSALLSIYKRSSDLRMANDIREALSLGGYKPLTMKMLMERLQHLHGDLSDDYYQRLLSHVSTLLMIDFLHL
jgi:hypothetical protein